MSEPVAAMILAVFNDWRLAWCFGIEIPTFAVLLI